MTRGGATPRSRVYLQASSIAERRMRTKYPKEWKTFYDAARKQFMRSLGYEYTSARYDIYNELVEHNGLRDGRSGRVMARPVSERRHTCPTCDAEPGFPCHTKTGNWHKLHAARRTLNEQDKTQ